VKVTQVRFCARSMRIYLLHDGRDAGVILHTCVGGSSPIEQVASTVSMPAQTRTMPRSKFAERIGLSCRPLRAEGRRLTYGDAVRALCFEIDRHSPMFEL
jgi:hypothetical protein